jgi:hypothetical protein
MKKFFLLLAGLVITCTAIAGNIEKTFNFSNYNIRQTGQYQFVEFDKTMQAGLTGEPSLPYHAVALMLPPGEKAVSIEIRGEELTEIPVTLQLFPYQYNQPLSKGPDGSFVKKDAIYRMNSNYPVRQAGNLQTQYLNGYSFALSTFTPVVYQPATGKVSYYKKVTVSIMTAPDPEADAALENLSKTPAVMKRVLRLAQNGEMASCYPDRKSAATAYQMLIISPFAYQTAYQPLISYYANRGITVNFQSLEFISQGTAGSDVPEKLRNYIKAEYQNNGIEQVILGGDVALVPYRGFYCYVVSGSGYEDSNIPADLYFSGLDGNWNTNGDWKWGEPGEDDLLPEISVGRMSFSDANELSNMINKSIGYQSNPNNFEMNKPYLVSEFLYDPPMTWGSDYLELLIDDHSDNGYFTHGIPSAVNNVTRLYDAPGYNWSVGQLLSDINAGKAFIHHCGHSNSNYMMRLYIWDVTDQNFSQVNGTNTSYQLMYTHGCICGAFDDDDCIAERAVSIQNWLAGGVFNSRYGWFNQGQTEGPSAHLHREFISAIYNPDPDSAITSIGMAHSMSKIMTAPWCNLPGEFEPGAQRWCMYDCNVLGDPQLDVWRDNPSVGIAGIDRETGFSIHPNPADDQFVIRPAESFTGNGTFTLTSASGKVVVSMAVNSQMQDGTLKINTSGLPSGLYTGQLITEQGMRSGKVVILH